VVKIPAQLSISAHLAGGVVCFPHIRIPDSACFPLYVGSPHDFGPAVFLLPAALLVAFPMPGFLASLIIFGSIFLWELRRKSLSIGWLACWVWFCFIFLVAQWSAPLWYHVRDEWGYTFAFGESIPVAGITSALFFMIGLYLGRIAFEPFDCRG
jgi:hypothetical protein